MTCLENVSSLGRLDCWDVTRREAEGLRREAEEFNLDFRLWEHFDSREEFAEEEDEEDGGGGFVL